MKTNELTGAALDWAVAKLNQDWTDEDILANLQEDDDGGYYSPSSNWAQGGPIIEDERILIQPEISKQGCGNAWSAISMHDTEDYGPTPLIAAMRCYVASKLGDDIEIPEELTKGESK